MLVERFGTMRLDEIAALDVERFRDSLLVKCKPATTNRYRDLLSALFKRAVRDGHVAVNPVRAVPKLKENNKRVAYITVDEEGAIQEALPPEYRPHFTISINTGLRWSEQMNLRWGNVDLLTGFITIPQSKHGESRRVPINSVVRSVLVDLGSRRRRPDDPSEPVFWPRPKPADQFFPKAVEQARATLRKADRDASRLEGYVWHSNRHTFASRLAMAGVDLLTLKEVGGWKTMTMVERYAHLSPNHLHRAVERLVSPPNTEPAAATELSRN